MDVKDLLETGELPPHDSDKEWDMVELAIRRAIDSSGLGTASSQVYIVYSKSLFRAGWNARAKASGDASADG